MNDTTRLKIKHQIESNDPELTRLFISYDGTYRGGISEGYYPLDNDWEREGTSIGRNTHIKQLCLGRFCISGDEFSRFCNGFSCNKTITRLELDDLGGDLDIWTHLYLFIEQNCNLSQFSADFAGASDNLANGIKGLSGSLSKFNTLTKFECHHADDSLDDDEQGRPMHEHADIEALIQMLAHHPNLADIEFSNTLLQEKGITALAVLLEKQKYSLKRLCLKESTIGENSAGILARALAGNSTLRDLDISSSSPERNDPDWQRLITQVVSLSALENLNLAESSLDDDSLVVLANALASGSKLKTLNISQCCHSVREGCLDLFDAIQSPQCMLQELNLRGNTLDDALLAHLSNSWSSNCALKSLSIGDIPGVSSSAWATFANIFRMNSSLEKVDMITINSLTDGVLPAEVLISFANSLVGNSKLKELYLDDSVPYNETGESNWQDAFSLSLGNQSSVLETYNSNHTLQRLFQPDRDWVDDNGADFNFESLLPPYLTNVLQINRESTNKSEAARRKIITIHFSGDFSIQPFFGMDLKAIPHAIAWMAKDGFGRSLLYQYVRSSCIFVEVGGKGRKTECESKWKRQKC